MVVVSSAVEGLVDEAVVRKLIVQSGGQPGTTYGKNGKQTLRNGINGYNDAARFAPWIVLVDLNSDADCAPRLRATWLPDTAPMLCFRIAVREIEAWLMADAETLAPFLSIPRSRIPGKPEDLDRPKEAMVNLARRSRRKSIREDMVPREGSGRLIGPAYTSTLIDFVLSKWRLEIAAQHSESLRRAITCLQRVIREAAPNLAGRK